MLGALKIGVASSRYCGSRLSLPSRPARVGTSCDAQLLPADICSASSCTAAGDPDAAGIALGCDTQDCCGCAGCTLGSSTSYCGWSHRESILSVPPYVAVCNPNAPAWP